MRMLIRNRYNTLYETVEPNVSSNLYIADHLRRAWSDHGLPAGGREDEGRGLPEISGSPGYRIRTCLGRCRYPGRDQWLFRSEADHSAAEKETVGGKSPLASEHPAAGHARHSDHRDLHGGLQLIFHPRRRALPRLEDHRHQRGPAAGDLHVDTPHVPGDGRLHHDFHHHPHRPDGRHGKRPELFKGLWSAGAHGGHDDVHRPAVHPHPHGGDRHDHEGADCPRRGL